MTVEIFILTFFLFFIVATLYSSVGHAGASGYLAVMALLSFAPTSIKPISLVLNCLVALIASVQYIREGYFDRKIFLSFIVTSLPLAFVGGYIALSPQYFKLLAGIFLVVSAILLLLKAFKKQEHITSVKEIPLHWGLGLGAVIGLISGLIGVGGGIFLSPILIMAGWITVRNASGVSALFIFCNSVAGLLGHISALKTIDFNVIYWSIAVIIGGFIGSHLGIKKFNNKAIIICLFLVLLSAGLKFIFVDFS